LTEFPNSDFMPDRPYARVPILIKFYHRKQFQTKIANCNKCSKALILIFGSTNSIQNVGNALDSTGITCSALPAWGPKPMGSNSPPSLFPGSSNRFSWQKHSV